MWCVAELDEQYIGKMEDVLAVYEKPYDATQPVVCLDEKPIALHADVRSPIPAKPGKPAKQDNEYERCGTANVFGVVEPKTGRHFTTATPDLPRSSLKPLSSEQHQKLERIEAILAEVTRLAPSPSFYIEPFQAV